MADPKADVEELMNDAVGVSFAERMLCEHGEFLPYGAAMTQSGEIVSVAAHNGTEKPASQELISLLIDGFREAAAEGKYKATAIFYDVRVNVPGGDEKTDAVAVALDHQDNYSVVVFFPYRLNGNEVEYGELFAQAGENRVFDQ